MSLDSEARDQPPSQPFSFVSEVSRGEWIAAGVQAGSLPVPAGFDTVVRVLHPFARDRPQGVSFADLEAQLLRDPETPLPELDEDLEVTWRDAAAAHGTAVDVAADTRAHEVLGVAEGEFSAGVAADGWRYESPEVGSLAQPVLARVTRVLARHTATPGTGVAAVWSGLGGLTSMADVGFYGSVEVDSPLYDKLPAGLQRAWRGAVTKQYTFAAVRGRFGFASALRNLVGVRQPLGSGILSREAAAGPRLKLPERDLICFEAGAVAFADDGWLGRAPWLDPHDVAGYAAHRAAFTSGAPVPEPSTAWAQSPNLLWPDGHEWVLASDIDLDSTLIACSETCAAELLATPGVEAVRVEGASP